MKNRRKSYYLKSIIIILFLCLLNSIIYLMHSDTTLKLKGNDIIEISLMDKYQEIGYEAYSCGITKCIDLREFVTVDSNIDNTNIGTYNLNYNLRYKNKEYKKIRQVKVIDDVKPEIKLYGPDVISLCPNKEYVEDGYEAIDNYDGIITDKVIVYNDNNTIFYNVTDSSNNNTEVKRTIIKEDIQNPVVKLKGKNVVNLKENDKYVEDSFTAIDNCDGNISDKVIVTSNVNTSKAGTYTIKYSIKDNNGNETSVSRTIIVKKEPVFTNPVNANQNSQQKKLNYIKNLETYIKQKNYKVSIGYVNLKTGYTYTYKPNTIYYGASLAKTVGALYAYENMTLDNETKRLVEKAITVSDNYSHKKLTTKIGISNLRSYGRSLGASNFLTRSDKDFYGMTTVSDQIAIWKYLYKFVNTNKKGKELQSYFINSYYNYLLFDNSPIMMHKYGYYGEYYHDVGIVYSDQPYIVIILTKHGAGNYKGVVKDLSEKIYGFNKIDR